MKIAFVWQGITGKMHFHKTDKVTGLPAVTGKYGAWDDGLRAAMRIIEQKHHVDYFEPDADIVGYDVIMYWESPCTVNGPNKDKWLKLISNPIKKVLLFSGGPIEPQWFDAFTHTFVESQINRDELDSWGIPNSTAFGVNTEYFYPIWEWNTKIYDGMHHATSASWKRQPLLAQALGEKALIVGRFQPEDPFPFNESQRLGANVIFDEATPMEINWFLNKSYTLGQTSNYWGGGQRATLEALAAGTPVVAMKDSPKNCEYVSESGCGLCVDPDARQIWNAIEILKGYSREERQRGRDYVLSKWTAQHYADNLLKVIETLPA